jgi:hypothetical protein
MTYFRDKVKIITVTQDKYGVITETEGSEIEANIKDMVKIIVDNNGKEVRTQATIMINKDNTVKVGDKIKITERFGIAYTLADKKFLIYGAEGIGGITQDLIRITI